MLSLSQAPLEASHLALMDLVGGGKRAGVQRGRIVLAIQLRACAAIDSDTDARAQNTEK